MKLGTAKLLKTALSALHLSGAHHVMAPITRGRGVIFMLHRVTPEPVQEFEPNRILRITPDFLEQAIRGVRGAGFDIVSLDDAHERLLEDEKPDDAPFACFTFDDGYRDNLQHAYPILKREGVSATIYVPANYPGGGADLWWMTLEQVIRVSQEITVPIDGMPTTFSCNSLSEKNHAFDKVYAWMRRIPESEARAAMNSVAEKSGVDPAGIARDLIMNWDELRTIAADPLITIGGHTCGHFSLSNLSVQDCAREMVDSMRILEEALGIECRHFAYPYGDESSAGKREFDIASRLGITTAVTTRKGVIHTSHRNSMMALPRLSLNGDYQDMRYIDVLLSGAPFALWNTLASCRNVSQKVSALLKRAQPGYPRLTLPTASRHARAQN